MVALCAVGPIQRPNCGCLLPRIRAHDIEEGSYWSISQQSRKNKTFLSIDLHQLLATDEDQKVL